MRKRKLDKENYAKIIGTIEQKKIKARKGEHVKFIWIISRDHQSIRSELKIMVLWRELMNLKHRFKNVHITFV